MNSLFTVGISCLFLGMIIGYFEYARELKKGLKAGESLYRHDHPACSDNDYLKEVVNALPELISFNKIASATHPDEPTRRYHRFNAVVLSDYYRLLKKESASKGGC